MSFLVTGSSGFIGGALASHLEAQSLAVLRCARNAPADSQLADCKTVIHCAGIAHRAASEHDYKTVNYQQTLDLAERAAAAGVSRFVFVSSVNAALEHDTYGRWKRRTELALTEAHVNSGMSVVCLRPALVYGPGAAGNLARLIALVKKGLPTPPPGGERSMIGSQDLCRLLQRSAEAALEHGCVLVATDGESYSLARLHAAIKRACGREPGPAWLPRRGWRLACACLDLAAGKPFSGETYRRLFTGAEYSNARTCALLSWTPRQRFEDVVREMLPETGQ
ncbi:MAG: NAD-dependent epimerase/dehydratase family protein [Halieaceae bacterium]|nr:NAD-dependent epimerase/dehydratase family protein [Halieaceae bacterium]